jgi:CubicO group peptidase (beta-lactamase class C family)
VVRDGKVVLSRSWGTADLEHGAPVTLDSRFQFASSTKMLTGTLVMMLVQEGRLRLEDPISKFFPDAPASWGAITVEHLATHTSGMAPKEFEKGLTLDEAVAAAMKEPLAAKPGETVAYGSLDFSILAAIIEKVTGQPFDAALEARILAPLGMQCTGFEHAKEEGLTRTADLVPHRVTTYRWSGTTQRVAWFLYPSYTYAAGGLFSCIGDVARFLVAIENGTLLRPETARRMWTAPTLNHGTTGQFAIGWTVAKRGGRTEVGHSGGPALADVVYLPDEKLAVVVLTNQKKLFPILAQGIADLLLPASPPSKQARIADDAPPITAAVQKVITGMATGSLDPALFTDEAQRALVPMLAEWGPVSTGQYDPLTRLELLEDTTRDGRRLRTYRAMFGRTPVRYQVTLAPDGRIDGIDSTPE